MFEDLTLLAMAHQSMKWLSRRQEVLASNIANVDTPKYQAKDVAPPDFKDVLKQAAPPVRAVVTNPKHISPEVEPTTFETVVERRPEESKPNGNSVVLEEQMQKIGDVKSSHDLAAALLGKHISMLKTALDKGGV
jgi:flagellar basal-body rod protein FlgB